MKSNSKKTLQEKNSTHSTQPSTTAKPRASRANKNQQSVALLTPRVKSAPASASEPTPSTPAQSTKQGTRIDKMSGLPSKSAIFDVIFTHASIYKRPINTLALAQELSVPPTKVSGLQKLLDQLAQAGDIKISTKGLLSPNSEHNLVYGTLQAHRDGYGFIINPNGEDVFVNERNMNTAWHGDKVAVRIIGTARNGKREGDVVEVTERKLSQVVGHVIHENGVWLVNPDDVRLRSDILLDANDLGGATANQVVVVALKTYGDSYTMPTGRVVEVLGNADDPGMEIEIAVRKFDIPHVFSEATERQTAQLPDTVIASDLTNRVDLRDVPLVTIDGEDARDFDDAVYCEPIKRGRKTTAYRLLVAIADVSHYVRDKTPLNEDAVLRSTSVYFPRRVVPMLPEKLSNGLCSLNPHVDRLCMVADMVIDLDGQITAYQFYPAVMHSAARLTYTQVWEYVSEGTGVLTEAHKAVAPHIKNLYALYQIQLKAREARGAMEFETTETYIVSDEKGKIKEILPRTRNDAHRLIEECMLAANVCAAEFIAQCERPSLYRVHEGPTPEKLEALRRNLALAGLRMEGGDKPTPKDYAKVMAQIAHRPDAATLQTLLLRSMQQAVYSPDNQGHFGLAYSAYTHFTSPIRRYPDLLVHRTIKAILQGQRYTPLVNGLNLLEDTRKKVLANDVKPSLNPKPAPNDAQHNAWVRLGEHTSMCERRADEASYSLKGRASGKIYRLGDEVQVRIAAVDSDTRKIDFVLESQLNPNEVKKSPHSSTQTAKKPQISAKSAERNNVSQRSSAKRSSNGKKNKRS